MPQSFFIHTSSRFLRDARKRLRQNPELVEALEGLRAILGEDPYNRTRQYHITKLKDIKPGSGQ